GLNWERLGGNPSTGSGQALPVTPVHDLILKENDLGVATHCRSFWILDDVTALHQVADAADGDGAVRLLQPRPKVRMRVYSGFGNEPTGEYLNWKGAGTSVIGYRQVT